MPDAFCTRRLVCKNAQRSAHESNRYRRSNPAFPAQWFYGLCRALPGDEFVLSPSLADQGLAEPGWARKNICELGTSNGCRDHTVLPYARYVVRSARRVIAHEPGSPCDCDRADALASTASRPAFVTTRDPPLLLERDGAEGAIDLRGGKAKYFHERGLDDPNHFERLE
jgi:hypothetical protein